MPRRSLEFVAAALLALAFAFPASAQQLAQRAAMMQGLDKVTARVSTFPLEVDKPARFGTLEITLKACHKRPPEEPPESAAFLEIRELRLGEQPGAIGELLIDELQVQRAAEGDVAHLMPATDRQGRHTEPGGRTDQSDLAGVPTGVDAVDAPDELVAVPGFDAVGDAEAMHLDEDFLRAIASGSPFRHCPLR